MLYKNTVKDNVLHYKFKAYIYKLLELHKTVIFNAIKTQIKIYICHNI